MAGYNGVVKSLRPLAALVIVFALSGCATAGTPPQNERSPQARCLSRPDPGEPDVITRPLFFLFCIQSS